jgi:hypothetical protein
MNRVSTWASMLTGLVAPRRDSRGDVALDSRQHSSGFGDSQSREPGGDALGFGAARHYGSHDPVTDAPKFLWTCICGATPLLRFKGASQSANTPEADSEHGSVVAAHVVRCTACGRSGKPGFAAWEAITDWNKSNLDLDLSLDQFPFFELGGLSLREARVKLVGIRTDLETRRLQAKQRQREGRDAGRRYRDRIDAYLRWTIVAQALALAHSRRAGQGAPVETSAVGSASDRPDSVPGPAAEAASLTASMLAALRLASEGKSLYADCAGRSEHGARLQTVRALVRRGLLDGRHETLTASGMAALSSWREQASRQG